MEQIMWKSFDKRLAEFLLEECSLEGTNILKIPMKPLRATWARPGGSYPNASLFPERGYGQADSWNSGGYRQNQTGTIAK